MKILIDIGHPAHVHLFKNFASEMQQKGHFILFTCRERELVPDLIRHFAFNYTIVGRPFKNSVGKFFGVFIFTIRLYILSMTFKPDLLLSHGSMYAAFTAFFLRKPHISFEDTFNFEQVNLYKPFTHAILTSDFEHSLKSDKVIRYAGYHELAYLHPKRFTPDRSVIKDLGLIENEPYVILRFVSWHASHDAGHQGLSFINKLKLVKVFSEYSRVFISSESLLHGKLLSYKFPLPPHRMHDAIAFASLVFGESSTMSEEAAMLGVPSIYLFNNSTYYTQHLERDYGLMFNFSESIEEQKNAIDKGVEILKTPDIKEHWIIKRDKMLSEKIDLTSFFIWFIENYPNSQDIMKTNPDYQFNFK